MLRPKTYKDAKEALAKREQRRHRRRERGAKPKEKKGTGEAAVFREIALQRAGEHQVWKWRCEVCTKPLHELRPVNFSHLLPKGSYPRYRLLPANILIKCSTCHHRWHSMGRTGLERGDYGHADGWRAAFEKHDELKAQYNAGR